MKTIFIIAILFLSLQVKAIKIVMNIQNGLVITSEESFPVSKCTVYTDDDVTVNTYESESEMNSSINVLSAALFPELPSSGAIIENYLYSYSGTVVRCLQGHERTIFAPIVTPALFAVYRENSDELEWTENESVMIGWRRICEGVTYECLQSHQTLSNWHPTLTLGVLWKIIETEPSDCETAKEWNANDHWTTYSLGDLRVNAGSLWRVINVGFTYYEPSGIYGHYGWEFVQTCN